MNEPSAAVTLRGFARVEAAVVVLVEEDGPSTECDLAGVARPLTFGSWNFTPWIVPERASRLSNRSMMRALRRRTRKCRALVCGERPKHK